MRDDQDRARLAAAILELVGGALTSSR
jgi:hypothetical protein